MSDLPTHLRRWTHAVDAVPASDLMDEAAAEIERLRWRLMTLESAARYAEGKRDKTSAEKTGGSGTVTPAAYHENDEKRAVWPTNHDAAPAATARTDADSDRTDKAVLRPGEGTGETLSEAEIDALEFVVEEGRIANIHDYGILRSLLIRLRREWEFRDSPEPISIESAESATTPARSGALSGCETVPDPDSRVWETQRTPQPQATPTQGSVPCEGSVPDSRTENEPVAWAVMPANSDYCVTLSTRREAAQKAAERKVEVGEYATMDDIVVVPLYRHPQPTLTDAERSLLAMLADHPRTHEIMPYEVATLRGLLERTK